MKVKLSRLDVYVFLLPAIVILLIITIFPLLYSLNISFRSVTLLRLHEQEFVGLANYFEVFRDSRFYNALTKTLFFSLSLPFQFFIGLVLALFCDALPGKASFKMLFLLPMIITPIVVSLVWRFMFNPTQGIINYFLQTAGLGVIPWLSSGTSAMFSAIIVEVWQWTPFFFLVLYTGLRGIPVEPIEAGMVDGASRYHLFRYVKLPFLTPIIAVALLIRLMDILRNFDLFFGLTQGGPGTSTEVLNFYIYMTGFRWFRLGYSASLSYILLIIIIILSNVLIKYFRTND